jgi:hypothetical protein
VEETHQWQQQTIGRLSIDASLVFRLSVGEICFLTPFFVGLLFAGERCAGTLTFSPFSLPLPVAFHSSPI